MAPVTLYFLQTSRAIRTAWLLEELGVDYNVVYHDREANGDTPEKFRNEVPVGRAPAIKDGNLILLESGAIAEYVELIFMGNERLNSRTVRWLRTLIDTSARLTTSPIA